MADFWTEGLLERLVDEAAGQPDIKVLLEEQDRALRRRMRERVLESPQQIQESPRSEIEAWDQLLKQLAEGEKQAAAAPVPTTPLFRLRKRTLEVLGYGLLLALLVVYPISAYFFGWSAPWDALRRWGGGTMIGVVVAAALALLVALAVTSTRYDEMAAEARRLMRVALDLDDTKKKAEDMHGKAERRARVAAAQAWSKAIHELSLPIYGTRLDRTESPGLDAAIERDLQVKTPAHKQVERMIDSMRGGAIGIAGPRGAGKSTLITWFCHDTVRRIGQREVLTVSTSAPVDYQARDFLLHLFASLCHRTLERLEPGYRRAQWKRYVALPVDDGGDVWQALLPVSLAALGAGLVLAIVSIAWAADSAGLGGSAARRREGAASAPVLAASAMGPLAASGTPIHVPASSPAPSSASSPASLPTAAASAPASAAEPSSAARELGLTPALLFATALLLLAGGSMALGVTLLKARRLPAPEDPGPGIPAAPGQPEPAAPPGDGFGPWLSVVRWYRGVHEAFVPARRATPSTEVAREALHWLAEIKFQQSYTAGWSGALKLPAGLEGSLSQARSLAQQQLSLPEIVDAFTRYLAKVAASYTVVIGIDELDKIESDEKAQRFLNDIKVIFGGFNAFFLVSVSENAMSAFERRGLPFRDAFDSAFDDVVVVQHLAFRHSRRLLGERVVAMPVQFQALCHVLAAGLPRELVRSARDLAHAARDAADDAGRSLEALVQRLIENEIEAKAWAFNAAAERLPLGAARDAFLAEVRRLTVWKLSRTDLLQLRDRLLSAVPAPARRLRHKRPAPPEPAAAKVLEMREELGTFLYFLALVQRVFTSALDEAAMKRLERDRVIDLLAEVRRGQAVNQAMARALLDELSAHLPGQ